MWRAFVEFANSLRRLDFNSRGQHPREPSTGLHGPASNTAPRSKQSGKPITPELISARAAKVTNKSLRGLYLRQHQNLRKGV